MIYLLGMTAEESDSFEDSKTDRQAESIAAGNANAALLCTVSEKLRLLSPFQMKSALHDSRASGDGVAASF